MAAGRAPDVWSRYWAKGRIASCAADADGRYFPEIKRRWYRFFTRLPDGARVLDVATGNGAVIDLALDYAERDRCRFELHGVDAATPSPGDLPQRGEKLGCTVSFHGGTPAEQLPFPDGHFHATCAQFALEYTDWNRTVPEISRLLQPGGLLQAILHTADSHICEQTRRDLDDLGYLLDDVRILDHLRALLDVELGKEGFDASRLETAEGRAALEAFRDAAGRIALRVRAQHEVQARLLKRLMTRLGEIYEGRYERPADVVMHGYDQLRSETLAHRERLSHMRDAALSQAQLQALRELLSQNGLRILSDEPVRDPDGALLGHQLVAERN